MRPEDEDEKAAVEAEIERLTQEMSRFVRQEEGWARKMLLGVGAFIGLIAGGVLSLVLVLVKFMNPISALGVMLVSTVLGLVAQRTLRPAPRTARSVAGRNALLLFLRTCRDDFTRARDTYVNALARLNGESEQLPLNAMPDAPLPLPPGSARTDPRPGSGPSASRPGSGPSASRPGSGPSLAARPGSGPSTASRPGSGPTKAPGSMTLPAALIQAKHTGRLVPLVGAGLSRGVSGNFPSWTDLPRRFLDECDRHVTVWDSDDDRTTLRSRFLEMDPDDPFQEIPREMLLKDMLTELDVIKQKLRSHYADALSAIFRPDDAAPGAAHQAVAALGTQLILTTNIDQLLEETPRSRQVYTWRQSAQALADIQRNRKVLFKLHGSAEDADSVVLTHNEYRAVQADPAYRLVVNQLLGTHTLLFIGYGMTDPEDLDIFLDEHAALLRGAPHFALVQRLPRSQELARTDKLRKQNIAPIHFDAFSDIVPWLEALARA